MTPAELKALPVGTRIRTISAEIPCRVENYKPFTDPFPYFPVGTIFEIVGIYNESLRQICVQLVVNGTPLIADNDTFFGHTTYDIDIRAAHFELADDTVYHTQIVY